MILKLPGFIDPHVHLREPGATHKEDFYTGSKAAVKGGFTFILDMPNNPLPTLSPQRLEEKIKLSKKSVCNIGFHYGTDGKNIDTFPKIWDNPHVFGLKIYCNHTTGNLLIDNTEKIDAIFKAWESEKPILVHAEAKQLKMAIKMAKKYSCRLHVCHISQKEEVADIARSKKEGLNISAGVTPHHLYFHMQSFSLSSRTKVRDLSVVPKSLNSFEMTSGPTMKPPLGTQKDQDALWQGIMDKTIDLIETDHAPHTKVEKEANPPAFGVPGLETAVSLLYKSVIDGKITQERFNKLLCDNAKRIFNIPDQPNTYVEFDTEKEWIVGEEGYETKCGWSPFEGWKLTGKVVKTVIEGRTVFRQVQST